MSNRALSLSPEERVAQRERFEECLRTHWNGRPGRSDFLFGTVMVNGQFTRYLDADTDNAWIGFQFAEYLARKAAMQ